MVDEPILGSPSVVGMIGWDAIDGRLAVDGEVSMLVQSHQMITDRVRLLGERLVAPRQSTNVAAAVCDKRVIYIGAALRQLPQLESIVLGVLDAHTVAVQLSVGGRSAVAPTAIRIVVPRFGAQHIGSRAILPKNRANIFLDAILCQRLRKCLR